MLLLLFLPYKLYLFNPSAVTMPEAEILTTANDTVLKEDNENQRNSTK
jgi:hypothetical protein